MWEETVEGWTADPGISVTRHGQDEAAPHALHIAFRLDSEGRPQCQRAELQLVRQRAEVDGWALHGEEREGYTDGTTLVDLRMVRRDALVETPPAGMPIYN